MNNYTVMPLTADDAEKLRKRVRGAYVFWLFGIGMLLLLALVMLSQRKYSRNPEMVWSVVGALGLILFLASIPAFKRMKRDEEQQVKYCGNFPFEKVIDSGRYRTSFFFKVVVDGKGQKLSVTKEIYDHVAPDQSIYTEFTPASGVLLKLVIDGKQLAV